MSSVDILADLGPSAEARAVARVLSAAAAPPWPHELRGYEAARRAFENAGATPVRRGAGLPLRRLAGVKLAAVAGALTVTGVAVAAEADVLPSPIQRAAHQMLGGVGVPDPDRNSRDGQTMASSPESSSGHPGALNTNGSQSAQSPDHTAGATSGGQGLLPGTPTGTADPSVSGAPTSGADALALCRAYVAHKGTGSAEGGSTGNGGLDDHDRRVLAALAGGADKIDAYCAQVLAAPSNPVPQPTGGPTKSSGAPSTTPPPTPDPSHDHKPGGGNSSSPGANAVPSTPDSGNGNGHSHTPDPSNHGR